MPLFPKFFNQRISIKSKVLLEAEIIDNMTLRKLNEKMVPIDSIVYKSFIKRFNEEYKNKLLDEQKILLNKFVTSFHNNGLELKIYLNEEVARLKNELQKSLKIEEISNDPDMLNNAKNVVELLESYRNKQPDQKMVEEVVKIQELVREINTNAN